MGFNHMPIRTRPPSRRLLFLDIDGVLNSRAWLQRRKEDPLWEEQKGLPEGPERLRILYSLLQIDPAACAILQSLCEETEPTVVLSSAWRLFGGLERNVPLLAKRGFTYPLEYMTPEITPEIASGYNYSDAQRGLEIEWWVLRNVSHDERRDLRIAILDDNSNMGRLLPRLIQTDRETGLRESHKVAIQDMLSRPLGGLLDDVNPLWTPMTVQRLRRQGCLL